MAGAIAPIDVCISSKNLCIVDVSLYSGTAGAAEGKHEQSKKEEEEEDAARLYRLERQEHIQTKLEMRGLQEALEAATRSLAAAEERETREAALQLRQ